MSEPCCTTCEVNARPAPPSRPAFWRSRSVQRLTAAGVALAVGAGLSWTGRDIAALAVFLAAIALCVPDPARRAGVSARKRVLDINVLMVIAVAGAAALGEWFEAAAVVWLFGVSQQLEHLSMERARQAIRSLMAVAPSSAIVRRDGAERTVAPGEVEIGDIVIVRPGERVPVDGVIVAGETAFDESPVTGESWPAEKNPGDDVFAGTINGTGAIEIQALRPASDSTIARIIHLVEHAQAQRAPV